MIAILVLLAIGLYAGLIYIGVLIALVLKELVTYLRLLNRMWRAADHERSMIELSRTYPKGRG